MTQTLGEYLIKNSKSTNANAKEIDESIKNIFGKKLNEKDWPWQLKEKNVDVKIKDVLKLNDKTLYIQMDCFDIKTKQQITKHLHRIISKEDDSGVVIHNYSLIKYPEYKGNIKIGSVVNEAQKEFLSKSGISPSKNIMSTSATSCMLDEIQQFGSYVWANHDYEFKDEETLKKMRSRFYDFCQDKNINITKKDLKLFTKPCHFAAFDTGNKTIKGIKNPINLTKEQIKTKTLYKNEKLNEEEIKTGKTKRVPMHIGKAFLMEVSWDGVWKVKTKNSEEEKFAKVYKELRQEGADKARKEALKKLKNSYQKMIIKKSGDNKKKNILSNIFLKDRQI